MQWRTIEGVTLDPLGEFNELEKLIRGLLAPAMLLDYLRYYVLFEDDGTLVKKIAGYHQFHAVRAAIAQVVTTSRPGGTHKGGVFSLAQDLLREEPLQANTRQDLRAKLGNRPSGGIVFATIQKFMPGEDEDRYPVHSELHNIVVIADEAHRTQYGFEARLRTVRAPRNTAGDAVNAFNDANALLAAEPAASYRSRYPVGYAQHLRDALPNATFVAFTGTPVSSEDRDTRAVFGDYIHVYDMQQAKDDGATVAIYFESRLARLSLNEAELPQLDDAVDELAEDEEEGQQARLKSQWAALEKVVGAGPRIASVAADLVAHFEAVFETGKVSGKVLTG